MESQENDLIRAIPKINKTLSVIVPCFNEQATLLTCINRIVKSLSKFIAIEIVIVDDCSKDASVEIGKKIAARFPFVTLLQHNHNQGKGAALRTGFEYASGDYIAIQDADLEYNPNDLIKLVSILEEGDADVVFGSRFLTSQERRVLYYWHSLGNKFLTLLSNMFSDLNLTDMETCYKVFKKNIIKNITIEENRFGFEPEIVAKVAQKKCKIFEAGISYHGRTYEEGKKIGWKDGVRAIYCILHYNTVQLPAPMKFLLFFFIDSISLIFNLILFLIFSHLTIDPSHAIPISFVVTMLINAILCKQLVFRSKENFAHKVKLLVYASTLVMPLLLDYSITLTLISVSHHPLMAKAVGFICGLICNGFLRKIVKNKEKYKFATPREQ